MAGQIEIIWDICDNLWIMSHVFTAVTMWSTWWMRHTITFDVLNWNTTWFGQLWQFKVIWFQFSPDVIQANCLSNEYILASLWLLPHMSSQTSIFGTFVSLKCAQFLLTQTRPSKGTPQIRQDQKASVKTRKVLHTRPYSFFQRAPLTHHGQAQRYRNLNMVEWLSK